MKKILSIISIATIAAANLVALPAYSQTSSNTKSNYIGPQFTFGNATGYGVNGKFGVADNISIRPFASFYNFSAPGSNVNVTFLGAAATYDFNLDQPGQQPSGFSPYAGLGYEAIIASGNIAGSPAGGSVAGIYAEVGTDYHLNDSFVLNANYKFKSLGALSIGAGFKF
jgi:Outer membrane protein beta-barrel domain